MGYLRKSYEITKENLKEDALNPVNRAHYILLSGYFNDMDQAEEEYKHGKTIFGDQWYYGHGYTTIGRLGARNDLSINEIPEIPIFDPIWSIGRKHIEDPEKGLAELHKLYRTDKNLSNLDLLNISIFAAYFGDPKFSLNAMESSFRLTCNSMIYVWAPLFREVRQLPRFKELMKEIGLVEYWKEYGWPDFCRPVGDDDFVCD